MEQLVIKPIEDQLDGVDNLDQLSATAQEGSASIVVQFKLGTDFDLAAIDVQRRVDTARVYMPTDLDPPAVYKNGASRAAPRHRGQLDLALAAAARRPRQQSDQAADRVRFQTCRPSTSMVPPTASSTCSPIRRARRHGRDARRHLQRGCRQQRERAGRHHDAADAGNDRCGPRLHRSSEDSAAIPLSPPTVLQYPVKSTQDRRRCAGRGQPRRDAHASRTTTGNRASTSSIGRNINADEIKSTAIARDAHEGNRGAIPAAEIQRRSTRRPTIQQKSLNGVWQSLIEGIVLTAIVMLLFLHAWRNAVVVMIAIPTSILATFIVMKLSASISTRCR